MTLNSLNPKATTTLAFLAFCLCASYAIVYVCSFCSPFSVPANGGGIIRWISCYYLIFFSLSTLFLLFLSLNPVWVSFSTWLFLLFSVHPLPLSPWFNTVVPLQIWILSHKLTSFPWYLCFPLSGVSFSQFHLLTLFPSLEAVNFLVGVFWLLVCTFAFHLSLSRAYTTRCSWNLIWTMKWLRLRKMHSVIGNVRKMLVLVVGPLPLLHLLVPLQLVYPLLTLSFGMLVLAPSLLFPRKEM